MTDPKTDRFLQSHEKEREKLARQEEKLEAARKALARAQASSADKHEKWHRYKLAYHDREAGYEGRHADARDELRRLPVWEYCELVRAAIPEGSPITLVQAELATVERDFDKLTAAANKRYLDRDDGAYREALNKWKAHDRANPGAPSWRSKVATREQWHLIDRIVMAAGVGRPGRMTRGEAHDWIDRNGGNPRYPVAESRAPVPQDGSSSATAKTASGDDPRYPLPEPRNPGPQDGTPSAAAGTASGDDPSYPAAESRAPVPQDGSPSATMNTTSGASS